MTSKYFTYNLGFTAGVAHRAAGGRRPLSVAYNNAHYCEAVMDGYDYEDAMRRIGRATSPHQASVAHGQAARIHAMACGYEEPAEDGEVDDD